MRYLVGRYDVSTRRACGVIRATRSSADYRSRKDSLTALRQRMRELAQARVRFGYRRLRVLLLREGWKVGKERFYRVYTEEGLALRRKRPWRHAIAVHREQRRPATTRNDIRSMDFVRRVHGWASLPDLDGAGSGHPAVPRHRGGSRAHRPSRGADARAT